MKKIFAPTIEPREEKIPMDMLLQGVADTLQEVMRLNGYPRNGYMVLMHDLETSETGVSGNLNRQGMIALLESALGKLREDEGQPASAPNDAKH